MSCIRYFDSIPHIVRYGMKDEDNGKSWTLFWRNAVGFRVSVSRDDVRGTPFEEKWLPYIKEEVLVPGAPGFMKNWQEKWHEMCDLIITQSMPLLRELAPAGKQWVTIEDHLRTPVYEVKMVAPEGGGDAVATVPEGKPTTGPFAKPSYEHHPLPFDAFEGLPGPAELRRYHARDLTVLDAEKNWRAPPAKVRSQDGEVFYFVTCKRASKNVGTGVVSNSSIDRINAHFRLYNQTRDGAGASMEEPRIPKLHGIVVSDAIDPQSESSAVPETETLPSADGQGQEQKKDEQPNQLLAGIVLTYVSKAKRLADVKKFLPEETRATELEKYAAKWREQITSAVRYMHDHRITIGGRTGDNPWYYINHYSVYIAPIQGNDTGQGPGAAELADADAWLMVSTPCELHQGDNQQGGQGEDGGRGKFEEQKALDWEAVEKLFQL